MNERNQHTIAQFNSHHHRNIFTMFFSAKKPHAPMDAAASTMPICERAASDLIRSKEHLSTSNQVGQLAANGQCYDRDL